MKNIYPHERIIDESFGDNDFLFNRATGYVERDYKVDPVEMFASPEGMPTIDPSEWPDRIKEQLETKSRISDVLLRNGIKSLDQGQNGYCWAFSTGGSVQAKNVLEGRPHVQLNPCMVGAIVKGGRNQGGWCGQSAKFIMEHGIAPATLWKGNSRDMSQDTPAMREEARKHAIIDGWVDLTRPVHGQVMTFNQIVTCLLLGIPVAGDFNWWGHSVMIVDVVLVEPGVYGLRIRNSWTDAWGDQGFSVLVGNRRNPDGAIAVGVTGTLQKPSNSPSWSTAA